MHDFAEACRTVELSSKGLEDYSDGDKCRDILDFAMPNHAAEKPMPPIAGCFLGM